MTSRNYLGRSLAAVAASLTLCHCITVTTVNIGRKTSLERQLMGDFERLSDEELLSASVRSQGSVGAGSLDDAQTQALASRRRQAFNRDDLYELKDAGCVGETTQGKVVTRECKGTDLIASLLSARERLLSEENDDRAHIIAWVIATDPALTPADRPQVEQVYARVMREEAKTGHWVQKGDGNWAKK